MKKYLLVVYVLICSYLAHAENRAVVCGISDYDAVANNYCTADAAALSNHLATLSDWNASNITLLTDQSATKAAINAAIDEMILGASWQDVCLFFFFGESDTSVIRAWDQRITFNELALRFANMADGKYVLFIDMGMPSDNTTEITLSPVEASGSATGMTVLSYFEYLEDDSYEIVKNSPFAYLMMEALNGYGDDNGNGVITAQEIADYIDSDGEFTRVADNTSGVNITSMLINNKDIYEVDYSYSNINIGTDGTPVVRSIIPATDTDYVKFTLLEESTVVIETNSTFAGTDTKIWLYSSSGVEIAVNDDNPDSGISGFYLSKITKTLPAGTYRVNIEHYSGASQIPSYSVRVSVVGLMVFIAGPDFVYEDSQSRFLCLMDSYYDDMQVDADWQCNVAGWFDSFDVFNVEPVAYDMQSTVTASFEGSVTSKDIVVRNLTAPDTTVEYRAVICGIADYSGTINDLNYSSRDAVAVRNQLLKDPMWKNENITLLLDSDAKYMAIKAAISDMATASDSDDVCLFFYSGHGIAISDMAPFDESDGLDECLVAYDANIRDDEFGQWVNDLPTNNYVVFIDNCYSGGQIKSIDNNAVKGIGKLVPAKGDGFAADISASVISVDDLNDNGRGVVVTASDDDELSWEGPELAHGDFTYYLLEALRGSGDSDGDGFVSAEECYAHITSINLNDQTAQIYDAGRLDIPVMQYNADVYMKSINISGSDSVALESQNNFACTAVYSNGSQVDITGKVEWVADTSYAIVSDYGVVTTGSGGAAEQFALNATYNNILSNSINILIQSPKYSGGQGSSQSPYIINTVADILSLSQSSQDWDSTFTLTSDIDMAGIDISPIGPSWDNTFSGSFDGAGKEIRNLTVNTAGGDYAGLFGSLGYGAEVKRLGLVNVDIIGGDYVGAIAGWCNGVISQCLTTGKISGAVHAGGICGGLSGSGAMIVDCYSLCDIYASVSGAGITGNVSDSAVIQRVFSGGKVDAGFASAVVNYYEQGSVLASFYDNTTITAADNGAGIGIGSQESRSSDVFVAAGWDFSQTPIWKIKQGYSPFLNWQSDFNPGDFNNDGFINSTDMLIMASNWLSEGVGATCDISQYGGDGTVDTKDFAILSFYWGSGK